MTITLGGFGPISAGWVLSNQDVVDYAAVQPTLCR